MVGFILFFPLTWPHEWTNWQTYVGHTKKILFFEAVVDVWDWEVWKSRKRARPQGPVMCVFLTRMGGIWGTGEGALHQCWEEKNKLLRIPRTQLAFPRTEQGMLSLSECLFSKKENTHWKTRPLHKCSRNCLNQKKINHAIIRKREPKPFLGCEWFHLLCLSQLWPEACPLHVW